jgi:predicted DCC family thiol-disulfide oxidoreductase YuxK
MRPPPLSVWYDGDCPLCRREVAVMRRLDRRGAIDFIDLNLGLACPLDRGQMLARFHAKDASGPLLSGAAAFAAMWRRIPILSPLGLLGLWPPSLWLLERGYRAFLIARPTLQRLAGGRRASLDLAYDD